VHLSSRFRGTIAGRQFSRASENALFAQEFPRCLATDCVLLSHALDRFEELFELLLAHEITVNLPPKFIQKMRRLDSSRLAVRAAKLGPTPTPGLLLESSRCNFRSPPPLPRLSENRLLIFEPVVIPTTVVIEFARVLRVASASTAWTEKRQVNRGGFLRYSQYPINSQRLQVLPWASRWKITIHFVMNSLQAQHPGHPLPLTV